MREVLCGAPPAPEVRPQVPTERARMAFSSPPGGVVVVGGGVAV